MRKSFLRFIIGFNYSTARYNQNFPRPLLGKIPFVSFRKNEHVYFRGKKVGIKLLKNGANFNHLMKFFWASLIFCSLIYVKVCLTWNEFPNESFQFKHLLTNSELFFFREEVENFKVAVFQYFIIVCIQTIFRDKINYNVQKYPPTINTISKKMINSSFYRTQISFNFKNWIFIIIIRYF